MAKLKYSDSVIVVGDMTIHISAKFKRKLARMNAEEKDKAVRAVAQFIVDRKEQDEAESKTKDEPAEPGTA